jgi:hypothetical protein
MLGGGVSAGDVDLVVHRQDLPKYGMVCVVCNRL